MLISTIHWVFARAIDAVLLYATWATSRAVQSAFAPAERTAWIQFWLAAAPMLLLDLLPLVALGSWVPLWTEVKFFYLTWLTVVPGSTAKVWATVRPVLAAAQPHIDTAVASVSHRMLALATDVRTRLATLLSQHSVSLMAHGAAWLAPPPVATQSSEGLSGPSAGGAAAVATSAEQPVRDAMPAGGSATVGSPARRLAAVTMRRRTAANLPAKAQVPAPREPLSDIGNVLD